MSRFYQCFLLLFGLTFSWLIPTAHAEKDAPNTVHYEEDIYFYHTDHLGGTRYITDKNGDVVESILTFPGGEPWVNQTIRRSADDYKTPYTFTGKEQDASGLYYYGARYYDPRAQIWASVDPILNEYLGNDPSKLPGMGGIFNSRNLGMYSYSFNNPFNLFDPDGNSTKSNYERNLENWAAVNGSTVEQERAKRKQRNNEREAFVADAATTGVSAALMFVSFEKVAGWVSNFAQMAKAKVLNMMGKKGGSDVAKKGLPEDPNALLKRGYKETSHPEAAKRGHRSFEHSDSGDKLRFDQGKQGANGFEGKDHYHRYNPSATGKQNQYLDKNGNPCARGCDASHLLPGD